MFTAQKSGRLKRLMTELGPLVDQKVAGADLLLTLARIADDRGDVSTVARRLSDRIIQLEGRAETRRARDRQRLTRSMSYWRCPH